MAEVTADPTVRYAVVDQVARIEFNRPEASNAVDLPMALAFSEAVLAAGHDSAVRAVVVTGAGVRFCAGGDVATMVGAADPRAAVQELAETLDAALRLLAGLDKPVVAGVKGAVAGAGLAVMLSCDLVVAGQGTRFVAAYSAVGLTPDCGLSWMLPRAVGQQRALDLLLTNRVLPAAEAHAWGMVTELTSDSLVDERAGVLAATLAAGPAWALGQARRLSRASWESTRSEVGAEEALTIGRAVETDDASRLLAAFASR